MEVSTHLPSTLAETEEPLPRWQLITRVPGLSAISQARAETKRHGHTEGGIEHGDLGRAGHDGLAGLDAHQVGGIVQRPEREALFDGGFTGIVHQTGFGELTAAVQHAMADSADLAHGIDNTVFRAGELFQNGLDGFLVGREGDVRLIGGLAVLRLMGQAPVDADALAQTLGQQRLVVHVDKLVLERGAARVDDKNFHTVLPFILKMF